MISVLDNDLRFMKPPEIKELLKKALEKSASEEEKLNLELESIEEAEV